MFILIQLGLTKQNHVGTLHYLLPAVHYSSLMIKRIWNNFSLNLTNSWNFSKISTEQKATENITVKWKHKSKSYWNNMK